MKIKYYLLLLCILSVLTIKIKQYDIEASPELVVKSIKEISNNPDDAVYKDSIEKLKQNTSAMKDLNSEFQSVSAQRPLNYGNIIRVLDNLNFQTIDKDGKEPGQIFREHIKQDSALVNSSGAVSNIYNEYRKTGLNTFQERQDRIITSALSDPNMLPKSNRDKAFKALNHS